jgi:hypothetical protein
MPSNPMLDPLWAQNARETNAAVWTMTPNCPETESAAWAHFACLSGLSGVLVEQCIDLRVDRGLRAGHSLIEEAARACARSPVPKPAGFSADGWAREADRPFGMGEDDTDTIDRHEIAVSSVVDQAARASQTPSLAEGVDLFFTAVGNLRQAHMSEQ